MGLLRLWYLCMPVAYALHGHQEINPLALELDIYSSAHHYLNCEYFINQEG